MLPLCSVAIMKHAHSIWRIIPGKQILIGLGGGFVLLLMLFLVNEKNWRPLQNPSTWNVTANYGPMQAKLAIDRNMNTRWSSHVTMSSGMYFQVELEAPHVMNGLVLHVEKEQYGQPRRWLIKTSSDGITWHTIVPLRHIPYHSMLAIFWQPVRAQYIQVIQTSVIGPSPWMIYELDLLQPVVPWQFTRTTLISWIVAWSIVGIMVAFCFSPNTPSRLFFQNRGAACILTCMILLIALLGGWALRTNSLTIHEFSPEDISAFRAAAFEKVQHLQWITEYFEQSATGESWLYLFCARLSNQILQDPRAAFRAVSALFGLALSILFFFPGIFCPGSPGVMRQLAQSSRVERLLGSLLLNFGGVCLWMSPQGDIAVILLFFLTVYLLLTHRLLYQQGSLLWLPALSGLMLIGASFNSAFGLLPFMTLIIAGFSIAIPDLRPSLPGAHQIQQQLFRWLYVLLAIIPLPVAWKLLNQTHRVFAGFSLRNYLFPHLRQLIEYTGFTGIFSVVWWGFALLGCWQFIRSRRHEETFFYLNAFIFALLLNGFSHRSYISAFILILLLFLLVSKGLSIGSTWIISKFFREDQRGYDSAVLAILLLCAGYFGGFAYNSLYGGSPLFPFTPSLFQRMSQNTRLNRQLEELRQDATDECVVIGAVEPDLAQYLSATYDIMPASVRFSELLRQAEGRKFWSYLLISKSSKQSALPEIADFFQRYYTEYARHHALTIYRLRDEFQNVPRRYFAEDLSKQIGDRIQDDQAVSGNALIATPEDRGLFVFGPDIRLCTTGSHTAEFALHAKGGARAETIVAVLEVVADTYNVLTRRGISAQEFLDPTTYHITNMIFEVPDDNPSYQVKRVQMRVYVTGNAEVRVDYIDLIPPGPER